MQDRGHCPIIHAAAWLALLVLLLSAAGAGFAAPVPGIVQTRFRTWSTAQGLPQATVRAIAQDQTGFLWIGTQDGLARFDGYTFKVYRHERNDRWSLSANHVTAIVAGHDGDLWIGTQAGLNHYDPDLDRFTVIQADPTRPEGLVSSTINALLLDSRQRLWVATTGDRLQWLDPANGSFHDSGFGSRAPFRAVRSIIELRDHSLLLATLDGVWRMDTSASSLVELAIAGETPFDAYALAQGADDSLWIGTAEAGLYHFGADGKLLTHYQHDALDAGDEGKLHDNAVRALLFDAQGALWIAGNAHGLARLDAASGRFEHLAHDPSRPEMVGANRLWSLFAERHGLLIVGSWVNGFSVYDPRTRAFSQIGSVRGDPRTLPTPAIKTVYADADGTLWMGATEGGGLVHFDPERGVLRRFTHDPQRTDSLAHDFVQHVVPARNGGLWIATSGGGLDWKRPGADSFLHLQHDPSDPGSLASDNVSFVVEDHRGTLWVGTADRGLDERCARCSAFGHHRHDASDPRSIANDYVTTMLESRDGELWLGGPKGLMRHDQVGSRFEHYTSDVADPQSIGADFITTLAQDSRGDLWIGTQGGGLNRLVRDGSGKVHFQAIDSHSGLASNAIGAIIEDRKADLWVSTTVGISRIDSSLHVVNFGQHEGAHGLGYWINSGARLPDGRIVFGGLGGATLFDPTRVVPPPVPEVIVTGLLVQNEPALLRWQDPKAALESSLWRGHAVSLEHDGSSVTFEFAALDFTDPESIRYAYWLEGHDRSWIETPSNRRFTTYTDLSPGRYFLRVRARHNSVWSEPSTAIAVEVHPGLWESPLAYLLYALAAVLMIVLATLQTRASLRRKHRVQESIRLNEERLKLALWGSGSELWDLDLTSGWMHRDNQLEHLAVSHAAGEQTLTAFRPYVHPDDIERFEQTFVAHLRGQTPAFEASYRTRNVDEEWVWVLTRGRVVERDAQGRALRMSGTTSDSNALNQALAALRVLNEQLESRVDKRTAALQGANAELRNTLERLTLAQRQLLEAEKLASLGGMVAGIAHEINTPLGIGVTAASHLHEEAQRLSRQLLAGNLGDEQLRAFEVVARESTQMILRNLRRADHLVKSFKRVAVDQSSEDRRVVDLGACLDDILTTLGPGLKKTGHAVELDCAPDLVVNTAPGALYQIVSNLVMNSVTHAFPDHAAGTMRIRARRAGEEVEIAYSDDGVGMDDAVRARIFEPFFTTRRGQGGSGLGMHIIYNLVTQVLHGHIDCTSAPGQGTQFLIRFPLGEVQGGAGPVAQ